MEKETGHASILKKADAFLTGGLLLACGIAFFVFRMANVSAGSSITITVDGNVYGTYDLDEPQEIAVAADGRTTNLVVIEDGKAYMKVADCPDHLCIRQGAISHTNESIVCLPNRVVVTAVGEAGEFDAITD